MSEENLVQRFLDKETTRREFLQMAAKGAATLAVGATLLNLVGCSPSLAEQQGQKTGLPLPQGMLVADSSLCTGCGRCELACSLTRSGSAQPYIAGIKADRGYQFGQDGPKLNYRYQPGTLGSGELSPQTCRQCRAPFCANVCPKGAILPDPETGARRVDAELCDGCGTCAAACPWQMIVLSPTGSKAIKCITCGACVEACPTGALSIQPWQDL